MAKAKLVVADVRSLRKDNKTLNAEVAKLRQKEQDNASIIENLRAMTAKEMEEADALKAEVANIHDEILKKNDAIKNLQLDTNDLNATIADHKEVLQERGNKFFEK